MTWKTIALFVSDMTHDGPALDAAAELATAQGGHLDIYCLGIDPTQPETFYAGAQALAVALPSGLAEAERSARELETQVKARMAGATARWSVTALMTPILGLAQVVGQAARFADVVVAPRPYGPGRGPALVAIVEAALFTAGVPVLVLPDRPGPLTFRRIALAWNESAEALRAARAALPLLTAAAAVDIVVIDPPAHAPDRSDPGGRMAQFLARHGARPEVRVLARTESSIAAILARHCTETAADLLVMGAYGHSRLRESILGGATRAMLEAAKLPVLMVH